MQVPVISTRGHGISLEANLLLQGPLSSSRMVATRRHGVARPEQRQSPSKLTQREPFCHPYRHSQENTDTHGKIFLSSSPHAGPWYVHVCCMSGLGNRFHTASVFWQYCPYWVEYLKQCASDLWAQYLIISDQRLAPSMIKPLVMDSFRVFFPTLLCLCHAMTLQSLHPV